MSRPDPTAPSLADTRSLTAQVSAHRRLLPPRDVYPIEPWRVVERRADVRFLAQFEALFATSNGYLGIRATPEEGLPVHERGTYLNGFYESWPIAYAEEAYGFPKQGQTLLCVPDGTLLLAQERRGRAWKVQEVSVHGMPGGRLGHYLMGFGTDLDGEIYVLGKTVLGPSGDTGKVFRITRPGNRR